MKDNVRLLLYVNSGSLIFDIVATELVVNNPVLVFHYTGEVEVIIASIEYISDASIRLEVAPESNKAI